MTTPQHYDRLFLLFESACGLQPNQRSALLDRECADDPTMRREVDALLARDSDPSSFLESPALGETSGLGYVGRLDPREPDLECGHRIDGYVIREKLGEGGIAVVYLAEQEAPVRRRVALKMVKPGMDSRQVIARFEAERQALAMMDHVCVAKVFDAGSTEAGRPYFVMEHVPGVPITEHCDRQRSSIEDRLQLFMQVCEAVQHAHQKGIIHRDLKPSNVLVVVNDGQAIPKVIDFGVAKALHQRLSERTIFTEHGQLIGTPAYMSPEQAELTAQDIDTRSDIYSLGVLLYELLTGALPFDTKTLRTAAFGEMQRIIREDEPAKPSTRLSGNGDESTTFAQKCRADPRSLVREVRGDLDWIVMKALEKDRTRRYETAHDLAMDVRRHLENEPVHAGPPTRTYRLRKFVRRNRAGVAAGMAVALALLVGLVGTTLGVVAARQQSQRAEASAQEAGGEAARARAVIELIDLMLGSSDPYRQKGPDYTVRALLDEFGATVEGRMEGQPLVEASIRTTVGRAYRGLGLLDEAETHLHRALELRRRELGGEHWRTLDSMHALAVLYDLQGRYAEAEQLLLATLESMERVLGEEHPHTLRSASHLADVYTHQCRYDEAEPLFLRTLEIQKRVLGEEHQNTQTTMGNLGNVYLGQDRNDEAEALFLERLEIARRLQGEEHPDTLPSMSNLAIVYFNQGRHDEAESLALRTLELSERVLGEVHPRTLTVINNLADFYRAQGRYAEAEPMLLEAIEIQERVLGEDHPSTLFSTATLAIVYREQGREEEAEPLYLRTLEGRKRVLGEEHRDTLTSMHGLAVMYDEQGRTDEAETLFLQALEIKRRVLGEEHPSTLDTMNSLAIVYGGQGRYEEAEPLYRRALEIRRRVQGEEHTDTLTTMANLGEFYKNRGRYDDAEPLLVRTLEIQSRILGEEHPDTVTSMWRLGSLYRRQGRLDEAEPLYVQAFEMNRELLGPKHPSTFISKRSVAILYSDQGRYDEAESLFLELEDTDNLANLYLNQGRLDEAETLLMEALEVQGRDLGEEHLSAMTNLALVYHSQGRYEDAVPLSVRTLEMKRRAWGDDHPETLGSMTNLANLYLELERLEEAEALYFESAEAKRRVLAIRHPWTRYAIDGLATVYEMQGREQDALPLRRELIDYQTAAARRPGADADMKNEAAWALLTAGQDELLDPVTALELAIEANDLTDHLNPSYLDTLSLAYHLNGDTARAIENQKRAMTLLPPGESWLRTALEDALVEFEAAVGEEIGQGVLARPEDG